MASVHSLGDVQTELSRYSVLAQNVFNVMDPTYGAKGDGVADDSGAIRAAVAAATLVKGTVYFPPGTYLMQSVVTLTGPIRILGAGRHASTLKAGSSLAFSYFFQKTSTSDVANIEVADLAFDGNSVSNIGGVSFTYVTGLRIRRCRFANFYVWPVWVGVSNGADSTIRNFDTQIDDVDFDTNISTYEQCLIFNAQDTKIRNTKFRNIGANAGGLGIFQNTERTTVEDCDFSGSGKGAWWSLSCNRNTFRRCTWTGALVSGLQGSRLGDNGAFGWSVSYGLTVEDCFFSITGVNSYALGVGATYDVKVSNSEFYRNGYNAVVIDWGTGGVSSAPRNITFVNCVWRENNNANVGWQLHPGLCVFLFASATLNLTLIACDFMDDRAASATQNYCVTFDGAFQVDGVELIGCRLMVYAANGGTSLRLQDSATLGPNVLVAAPRDYVASTGFVVNTLAYQSGWSAPTGTLSRAAFDQSTVTLAQLAQRVAALVTDLTTSGAIGA